MPRRPPTPPHFPYTTLFRSQQRRRSDPAGPVTSQVALKERQSQPDRGRQPEPEDPDQFPLDAKDLGGEQPEGLKLRQDPWHRGGIDRGLRRSEEHTSELQSPDHLVCRLLLEKKKLRQIRP